MKEKKATKFTGPFKESTQSDGQRVKGPMASVQRKPRRFKGLYAILLNRGRKNAGKSLKGGQEVTWIETTTVNTL